jgi:hypothetical protein
LRKCLDTDKELLASDGFEVETFRNPDEFLSDTQEHAVKLAVLDACPRKSLGS